MASSDRAPRNIVVAVDGSDGSQVAVRAVATRPWPAETRFRVLAVAVPYLPVPSGVASDIPPSGGYAAATQELAEHARGWAEGAADVLRQAGFSAEPLVRLGDARHEIVEEARTSSAELIVVGSHGRTGLKRLLMGSVAESVVRHAPCSVEVVREKAP